MPSAEHGPLGPELESRLRAELDAVRPPNSSPRYLAARPLSFGIRLAPAVLAVAVVTFVSLTAFAATGSFNPAAWTQRVITIVNTGHASPSHTPSPSDHGLPATNPTPAPYTSPSAGPSEKPEPAESPGTTGSGEPSETPAPQESPEPSSDGSDGGDGGNGGEGGDRQSGSGDRSATESRTDG
jgi:uncharacterized membrane protein YgcG